MAAALAEAWLEGLLLLLALAGPAGYLKNALCRRRLAVSGVMLPTVRELAERKKKTISGLTPSAFCRAGWRLALCQALPACGSGTEGAPAAMPLAGVAANFGPGPEAAAEGYAAGQGVCFLRLAPPTSNLWL